MFRFENLEFLYLLLHAFCGGIYIWSNIKNGDVEKWATVVAQANDARSFA